MQPQVRPPIALPQRPVMAPQQNQRPQPQVNLQPQITNPPNTGIADHLNAQVTRVDPFRQLIFVQSGFGNAAREFALHANAATRFFGPNGILLSNGLNNRSFVPGATIWYQLGNDGQMLSDVRTYNPNAANAQQQPRQQAQPVQQPMQAPIAQNTITDVRGQIVRVDPAGRTITVKSAEGETDVRIANDVRVWNEDRVLIAEGLTYRGLQACTDVWLRNSSTDPKMANEIRLFDPTQSTTDVKGVIVRRDPQQRTFVLRTGQGEVEYRVTENTRYLDANRMPMPEGLSYGTFMPGKTIWLRLGTEANAQVVNEVRFFDPTPSESQPRVDVIGDVRGQIVGVDPENGRLVLMIGTANLAEDTEFIVTSNTRYWDSNKMPFTEGLAHPSFRPGIAVWVKYVVTNNDRVLTEIRFADPAIRITPLDLDPIGALGYRTFPPGTYTRTIVPTNGRIIADIEMPNPTADIPFVR
jgi:hypothetical protein